MRKTSAFKGALVVLLSLLVIFVFLSFSSPLVPFGRISVEGAQRIEIEKIKQYIGQKTSIGLVSTSNKKYKDATEALGPLVEDITIDPGFFFKATVTVTEKQDTFVLSQGNNMARFAVDIEGNYIDDITPTDEAIVELSLFCKNPSQQLDMSYLTNPQYPFEVDENKIPQSDQPLLVKDLVGKILQTKGKLGFTFMNLIVNKSSSFLYKNHRGEYIFVGPHSENPTFILDEGTVLQIESPKESATGKDSSGKSTSQETIEYIMYTKVNLENAQGIFAETTQGPIVYFGTNDNLDNKFGALGHLADRYFTGNHELPVCIKLDIPYKVTTVPSRPVIGS